MTTNQNIFDTLVGIEGIGTPTDTVNTLNGITDRMVAFLVTDDGGTKAEMWGKVKSQALEFLESELIGGLSTYKDFSSVIDATQKVNISQSEEVYTSDGLSYIGSIVSIHRTPDKTKLMIKGIDFVSDTQFTTSVKVFNLLTGATISSVGKDIIVGANEVLLNIEVPFGFGSGLYYIGFVAPDGTVITPLNEIPKTTYIIQTNGTLRTNANIGINNVVVTESFVNVLCSIEYSYTKIIEDNKELLATAFKYACGAVMLDKVCVSKHADRETLINREANEALATMYRDDAIKFIKNSRNEIYGKINKIGSLKPIENKVQVYSLGSFV